MNLGSLIGYLELDTKEWDKGLGKAEGGIGDFAKKGAALAATAGVAIGAAVVAGLIKSMDIEAANDKLAAQLGLTAEESERVGGVAGKLYADAYGENLGEVNDAVGAVMTSIEGMSTASSADLEDMTEKAMNFATAFEVDVTRSTQVAGQMISQGLAKDGTEAFDLLVSASQQVPAAIREDLLDATDEYGGFFADLGFTGEQAMALLVDASDKGMYGLDKLGDAVKEFGIRATDMSKASAVGYDLIGESQEEMTGRLLAGGDTARDAFQEIIEGVQGIEDPVAQSQAALALFGTPLEDLSVQEIPAFLDALSMSKGELENVEGAAERMGDTLNDNAAAKIESFKRTAEQVFVNFIGGTVLPKLEEFRAWLVDTFGPAFNTIKDALTNFGDAFTANGDKASGSLGKIQEAIRAVVEFAGPAFETLKGIFQDVVVIVSALWNAFGEELVNNFVSAWQTIGPIVQGALDFIKGILDVFIGLFSGDWSRMWDGIKGIVTGAFSVIKGIFEQFLNITNTLASMALTALKNIFSAAWDGIKAAAGAAWNAILGVLSAAWNGIVNAVSSGVSSVVSYVAGMPGRVLSGLGNIGSFLFNAGKDMIMGFLNGIKNMAGAVADAAKNVAKGAVNSVKGFLGINSPSRVFMELGTNVGQGFVNGIAKMQPAVAAQMAAMANTQALGSLSVASPSWSPASGVSPVGTASSAAGGPLFHAETVNVIEGTPQDIAQELAYQGRTRGW